MKHFADEETECLSPKRIPQLVTKRGEVKTQLSIPSQVFFTTMPRGGSLARLNNASYRRFPDITWHNLAMTIVHIKMLI